MNHSRVKSKKNTMIMSRLTSTNSYFNFDDGAYGYYKIEWKYVTKSLPAHYKQMQNGF
jgi:hypothetical protein